jgi:hypothetical protein
MAREGTEMRRSAVKMADREMPTAKMRVAATTAMKTTAVMSATTVAAAVTTAMAATASRHGVSGRRQCGRENNDGNSQSEF